VKVVLLLVVLAFVAIRARAETPLVLADRAEQALRSGDKQGALELLDLASQATPATAESEDRIGFLFAVAGEPAESLEHFRKALGIDPNYPAAHFHLGAAMFVSGDVEHSLPELQEAVRLAPNVFDYRYRLGSAYIRANDPAHAATELKAAVALNATIAPAWATLGRALQGTGDLAGAVDAYGHAIALNPGDDATRNDYAYVLIETRQADQGIAESQRVLDHNASDPTAWMNIGYADLKKGEFGVAEKAYRQTLAIDPKSAAGHYDLAIALKMQDQIDSAKKELETALQLDPTMMEAHYTLALADWQLGDLETAIKELRTATAARPSYAAAHYMLGVILKQSGDTDAAAPELREAIRLDPTTPGPWNTLGQILRIKGDLAGSKEAFATGAKLKADKDKELANTLEQGMRGGMAPQPLPVAPK
jgi:tetratricopeptide (TPR) repeat protein